MDIPRANIVETLSALCQRSDLLPMPSDNILRGHQFPSRIWLVSGLDRHAYPDIPGGTLHTIHGCCRIIHKEILDRAIGHSERL